MCWLRWLLSFASTCYPQVETVAVLDESFMWQIRRMEWSCAPFLHRTWHSKRNNCCGHSQQIPHAPLLFQFSAPGNALPAETALPSTGKRTLSCANSSTTLRSKPAPSSKTASITRFRIHRHSVTFHYLNTSEQRSRLIEWNRLERHNAKRSLH